MRRSSAFATILAVSVVPAVAAEDGDARTRPYELGEIVVPSRDGVPGQIAQTVSREDISNKGARSLDEAVRAIPGVMVTEGGQGIPRIMIRGLPPRETPIFLNGVPLNSGADGQLDPALIPTENIQEVKIIQGSSSVLYGPGTTAGVIDIVTKRGTQGTHGDGGIEVGGDRAHATSAMSPAAAPISTISSAPAKQRAPLSFCRTVSSATTATAIAPTFSPTPVSTSAIGTMASSAVLLPEAKAYRRTRFPLNPAIRSHR